tara:strand:- start:120656 stop:121390 length:735 start_codon:yes stop_codon:yes gene_type:complete
MTSGPNHRVISGRIDYRISGHPDFPEGLWGVEHWRMSHHQNGDRVMRAYCELHDDEPLIRDVIAAVDKDFHPLDTYVRLTKDDKFYGSTWYNWSDTEGEYQGRTAEKGRITDKVAVTRAMRGFGTHNLGSDSWLCAKFDFSKGPGIQTFENNLLTSIDHRGATGPAFERTTTSSLKYSGIETVTVPAGTFECHRFAFVNTSNDHPPYDFWVTTDGDFLFIKGTVAEPYNWSFELMELHEERAGA